MTVQARPAVSCSFLGLLSSGMSAEEVMAEYPQLEKDDILAALAYGAEMTRERFVDLPGTSAA